VDFLARAYGVSWTSRICCDGLLNRVPSSTGLWNLQLMGKTAIDLGVPRFFIACYIFYRLHIMHFIRKVFVCSTALHCTATALVVNENALRTQNIVQLSSRALEWNGSEGTPRAESDGQAHWTSCQSPSSFHRSISFSQLLFFILLCSRSTARVSCDYFSSVSSTYLKGVLHGGSGVDEVAFLLIPINPTWHLYLFASLSWLR